MGRRDEGRGKLGWKIDGRVTMADLCPCSPRCCQPRPGSRGRLVLDSWLVMEGMVMVKAMVMGNGDEEVLVGKHWRTTKTL